MPDLRHRTLENSRGGEISAKITIKDCARKFPDVLHKSGVLVHVCVCVTTVKTVQKNMMKI